MVSRFVTFSIVFLPNVITSERELDDTLLVHIKRKIFSKFLCCHPLSIENPFCVKRNNKRTCDAVIDSICPFLLIGLINNNF